jgi:hypothetical protein
MHRLRRLRRVPRGTIVLVTLAVVALVIAHFVPGSKPKFVHVGNQRRIVDARAQVDPAIGIRPVDMSRDR